MAGSADGRRGIQSVEIGMRVLSAVAEMSGPVTLSIIAQQAGLSLSQTHRYLASLIASGMVTQEWRSGFYDLGPGALRIGLAALPRIDVFANAEEHLRQLVLETRRTCLVAVWGDGGPTVVRLFPGSPPVLVSLGVGSSLPLLRSAMGQIFYTFGDRTEMDRQAQLLALRDPANVPVHLDQLRAKIDRRGFAEVSGDVIPGLRAVAAPIFDLQGNLALVTSLIVGSEFPVSDDAATAEALLATCRLITESISGKTASPAPTPPAKPSRRSSGKSKPKRNID